MNYIYVYEKANWKEDGKLKLLVIVGTRPEIIRLAAVRLGSIRSPFSEEKFRSIFEKILKRIGLWKFACILTQTAERYLGCPKQRWATDSGVFQSMEEVDELTREAIRDIFIGGNFRRKQEGRVYETYLISSRGKDEVGKRSVFF